MTDLETLFRSIGELTADEVKKLYTYIVENRIRFVSTPRNPAINRAFWDCTLI